MAICPECKTGKHDNCEGDALDEELNEIVECDCWSINHDLINHDLIEATPIDKTWNVLTTVVEPVDALGINTGENIDFITDYEYIKPLGNMKSIVESLDGIEITFNTAMDRFLYGMWSAPYMPLLWQDEGDQA